MARAIVVAADRVLVSIPAWNQLLVKICPRARHGEWLPVPCNVATAANPGAVAAVRSRYAPERPASLVGHFGTFGRSVTRMLGPCVVGLFRSNPLARVLFIGRGSERYLVDIIAAYPELAGRVSATGELSAAAVAAHIRACDLLLQPYADGVSSRRTSVMAGLANRVAVVTNLGALSEPLWAMATGVAVVPGPDPAAIAAAAVGILALPSESRHALGARGAELYRREFTVERTIARLRESGPMPVGPSDSKHTEDGQSLRVPSRQSRQPGLDPAHQPAER
jgi:hypothetical protein